MDEAQPVLRAPEALEQLLDAVEAQVNLLPTRGVDVCDGIEIGDIRHGDSFCLRFAYTNTAPVKLMVFWP